jgi:hypothetical protein
MTVTGLRKVTVSQVRIKIRRVSMPVLIKLQNGVGAFILQCHKLSFHYCDWAGSSRGMKYICLSIIYSIRSLTLLARFSATLSKSSPLQTLKLRSPSHLAHDDIQSSSDTTLADDRRLYVYGIYRRNRYCRRQNYCEMLVGRS